MKTSASAFLLLPCVALLSLLSACGPSAQGTFDDKGFIHQSYQYRVLRDAKKGMVGDDWALDNYYAGQTGLAPKKGNEYKTTYELDPDGDGTYDVHAEEFTYDLRFKHKVNDGVIWLRTLPISNNMKDKDVRVIAQNYVDAIAGAGYEVDRVGVETVVTERRYAAEVLERARGTLAGIDAYAVTINVANIDQIKLTPNERGKRVRLIFARPEFAYRPLSGGIFPVLLIAGYANQQEDFSPGLAEFEDFLNRIEVKGERGLHLKAPEEDAKKPAAEQDAQPETPADGSAPAESDPGSSDNVATGDSSEESPSTEKPVPSGQ